MKPNASVDGMPKKADCSDCLTYQPVKWMLMAHGMEAVCAGCLANRKLTLKKVALRLVGRY